MVRIFATFLFFCFLVQHAYSKETDPVIALLPKFDDLVKTSMDKKKVPGLAIAIVSQGKIVYMKTFGVKALGEPDPITKGTLFQLGSLSKAISATLIAILKRDGILNLDQPIDLIPGITLRHVLSHTTGIPSAGFNSLIERGGTRDEAIDLIRKMSIEDSPGTKFSYHNLVYNFLIDVVEEKTGSTFEDALQEKLFRPLNMLQTSSNWDTFMAAQNRAFPHTYKKPKKTKGKKGSPGVKLPQIVSYRVEYSHYPAAGGVTSNIQDMAQFLAAVMGARPNVVTLDDLEEFITPIIHTPDQWHRTHKHRDRVSKTQYGLGWRHMTFANQPLVFHGGWVRGFCNNIAFLPEQGVGIVILQNAESSLASVLALQFFDWVLGMPPKNWIH